MRDYSGAALFFLAAYLLSVPSGASAYLDPGSGSFIFQIVIGAFLGGLFTMKVYYRKIKAGVRDFFSGKGSDRKNKGQDIAN